jgi:phosphoribosylglycinamide formyltransferase 1
MAVHQAILEKKLSAKIALVIGTKADAPAILRAAEAGLPTAIITPKKDDANHYERALIAALAAAHIDSIALVGYLRKLPDGVVAQFRHQIINVHPALLPAFGGQGMYGHHVHEAVIAYGAKISGCTVHFVDADYDTGPVILQKVVAVEQADTPETLAAKILPAEHAALIEALILLANHQLTVEGRHVRIS